MTTRQATRGSDGRGGGRFAAFTLGFVFALVALFAGAWLYLRYGHPPVAVADTPFPFEKQIVRVPLHARIEREMATPPFGSSEDAFVTGAKLYVADCASCHGVPGHESPYAKYMYPPAPQLWHKHQRGNVVGVSDDPAGESYWKIKNGIRLAGMPAYDHLLTTDQMWDIALLIKSADQPLPDPVAQILATGAAKP